MNLTTICQRICAIFLISITLITAHATILEPRLNVLNGLASNTVKCMMQDSQGFMWFGTNNGLCKYDGYSVKTYKSNYLHPTLFPSNFIVDIVEDSSNNLWIATSKGLCKMNLRTEEITTIEDPILFDKEIMCMTLSKEEVVFIGTVNGAYYLDQKSSYTFIPIHTDKNGNSIAGNYIRRIFIDSKNYVWIGTWNKGYSVYNFNNKQFEQYSYIQNQKNDIINEIFEDSEHNIWLSTWDRNGVIKIVNPHLPSQSEQLTFFPIKSDSENKRFPVVFGIKQNKITGDICLSTANGLQIIKNQTREDRTTLLNENNCLLIGNNEIYSIYQDQTGLFWCSITGLGVSSYSSTPIFFTSYNLPDYDSRLSKHSSIESIYQDSKYTWLGVKSLGFALLDREAKTITTFDKHPVLKEIPYKINSVYSFLKPQKADELWIGTRYDGIYIVKYKDGTISKVVKSPLKGSEESNFTIRIMINDTINNSVWIGTNRGLLTAKWNKKSLKYNFSNKQNKQVELNFKLISSLAIDAQNNLWVGDQNSGLAKITTTDSCKITQYYTLENKKLPSNEVLCLYTDSRLRLWAGTNGGGISLYNQQLDKFEVIEEMSLVSNDAVYSIQEDNKGNIWFSVESGLVCYNDSKNEKERIQFYSQSHGMEVYSFNQNASFKDQMGRLYFGGSNGFLEFSPEALHQNEFSPCPQISHLKLSNQPIESFTDKVRNHISSVSSSYTNKITVPYNNKNLKIEFSSLLYQNSTAIKYGYKLEGFDQKWNYVDYTTNSVEYNNLPPGEYTFFIHSSNEVGVWSKEVKQLAIKVEYHPWLSPWAYMLYFLLFVALLAFIIRLIWIKINYRRSALIERFERHKSEEVHQAKMAFFTDVSHEFFTPLTIILCSIDALRRKYPEEDEALRKMKANSTRLMRLLDQIMDFRRIETGKLKLKISYIDIIGFINEICDLYFMPMSLHQGIDLEVKLENNEIWGYIDVDKLDKIMFNLISNAFKYNKPKGKVTISAKLESKSDVRFLVVSVADTGYGMSPEIKQNLFEQFYEGNTRSRNIKSSGVGLSLTYNLVTFHNGSIEVDTTINMGTTFTIKLPIDKKGLENYEEFDAEESSKSGITHKAEVVDWSKEEDIKLEQHSRPALLIVEDNIELLNEMENTLKLDFHVITACNGQEALEKLTTSSIDVVVTDVVMPIMDGVELTTKIKNRVEFSHIPIVMLSAKRSVEQKIVGFNSGADVYITKPFEVDALVANLNSLIKNRKNTATSFSVVEQPDIDKFAHSKVDSQFLKRVIEMIENNVYSETFTVKELYAEFGMSQSSFYRKLQSLINISPIELVREIKLKEASKLLLDKDYNVSDVAYKLGFSDPKYFGTVFKKVVGMSPTDYIKQNRENNES